MNTITSTPGPSRDETGRNWKNLKASDREREEKLERLLSGRIYCSNCECGTPDKAQAYAVPPWPLPGTINSGVPTQLWFNIIQRFSIFYRTIIRIIQISLYFYSIKNSLSKRMHILIKINK